MNRILSDAIPRARATFARTLAASAFLLAPAAFAQALPPAPQPAAGGATVMSVPRGPLPAGERLAFGGAPTLAVAAQAQREVADDTAIAVLFVERNGADPVQLQSQVNATLQDALAKLRGDSSLRVRSGGYATRPRYARDGRVDGWTVRAELVAESSDMAAISRVQASAGGQLNVASLGFALSPARRAQVERELVGEAAERLRGRALEAARALGYSGVELAEATLDSGAPRAPVGFARATTLAAPADAAPMPVEPGRSTVTVNFNGTFLLLR